MNMLTPTPALLAFILVFAGLFGLVVGSFLNVVVYRVPAGIPLTRDSQCPNCDAPVRAWQNVPVLSWLVLRGRCARCAAPISARYPLVELATGIAFVAIAGMVLGAGGVLADAGDPAVWLVLVAFLYLAAISIALTLIDLDVRRLPNSIVLPSYLVAIVLIGAAGVIAGDWAGLLRAGIGMAALYLFYALLRFIRPAGMGGGDVKLAGLLGIYLGWLGWPVLVVGAFAAFVLGGVFGIVLMLTRRAGRRTAIPFGPWMLAGAWVGILAGSALGDWYLGLLHVGS
ncbi:A24 family peptidase [Microbacterium kribbense]|uniref:Prepilin leader peptidase/N-methyltransferase n=1 Tax=Microbacterium kribbense TaxID=433645 RepID=A0ABP7GX37_9MICO